MTDDNPIYFYTTVYDVKNKRNGIPILGGDRWFNISTRIPVLGMVKIDRKNYYEVVLERDTLIKKGYIEVTADIKEDIFFIDGDFDRLRAFMNSLKINSTLSKKTARKTLVNTLKLTLGKVTGQDFLAEAEDMKIEDFLQSNGIPTRENSPLFKHKISDLLDMSSSSKIQDCNVKQLFNWLLTSKEILKIVGRNMMPILVPLKIEGCDKSIPKYSAPIMTKFFPNNLSGYAYQDKVQGLRYLWIPKEFCNHSPTQNRNKSFTPKNIL